MVAPHPELQRRIINTDNIVKADKSQYVPNLYTKYPGDYIDLNTHSVLTDIQPWIEEQAILSQSPNIQNLWGPFFTTIDRVLVLCVDFSDKVAQVTTSVINDRFFSTTGNTFLNYFKEVSYSKWIPSGEVHGWYRAPHPYTYYINNDNGYGAYPNNAKRLVEDTIDLAIADPVINWSLFDTNGNNKIDNIIIVHAGLEAAWGGSLSQLWAHASTITSTKYAQSKSIDKYVLTAERTYTGASQRIGIDCHEFSHLLNLPDLYGNLSNNGVGSYSLMGMGCWTDNGITPAHLDAWSKYKAGFMDITANPQGVVTVNDVETNADAMKYTTADPKEYFLIENRQKILFDAYLPGSGLLIWHINENKLNNNDETCLLVGLLQADGLRHLENSVNNGDAADPYPGTGNKRSFGTATTPNSLLCDNITLRDMSITSISNSGNSMTFTASVPPIVAELPANCERITVTSLPHIEAATMVITKSIDPCIAGTCTVTVKVTWRNTGGSSGLFTPTILIDDSPTALPDVTLNAFETVGDSTIQTFTILNMVASLHTICPSPN